MNVESKCSNRGTGLYRKEANIRDGPLFLFEENGLAVELMKQYFVSTESQERGDMTGPPTANVRTANGIQASIRAFTLLTLPFYLLILYSYYWMKCVLYSGVFCWIKVHFNRFYN